MRTDLPKTACLKCHVIVLHKEYHQPNGMNTYGQHGVDTRLFFASHAKCRNLNVETFTFDHALVSPEQNKS